MIQFKTSHSKNFKNWQMEKWKIDAFCKKTTFLKQNGVVKEYFFQNSKKLCKGFQLFLKKL